MRFYYYYYFKWTKTCCFIWLLQSFKWCLDLERSYPVSPLTHTCPHTTPVIASPLCPTKTLLLGSPQHRQNEGSLFPLAQRQWDRAACPGPTQPATGSYLALRTPSLKEHSCRDTLWQTQSPVRFTTLPPCLAAPKHLFIYLFIEKNTAYVQLVFVKMNFLDNCTL